MGVNFNDLTPEIKQRMAKANPKILEELDRASVPALQKILDRGHRTTDMLATLEERSVMARGSLRNTVLVSMKRQVAEQAYIDSKKNAPKEYGHLPATLAEWFTLVGLTILLVVLVAL